MATKQYQHTTNGQNDTTLIIYNLRGNNRVIFKDGVLKVDINAMKDRAKAFLQKRVEHGIVEEKK